MTHWQCTVCDKTKDFTHCKEDGHKIIEMLDQKDVELFSMMPIDVNKTKLIELELSEYADIIYHRYDFKTFKDSKEILVFWDGVYQFNGEVVIREECQKLIPECSRYKFGEILAIVQNKTFTDRDLFNKDFTRIVVENGILNLDTLELEPFNPKFLTTIKIPVRYDPQARCPKFIKFLRECLSNSKDIVTVIEEISNILTANRKNYEVSAIWIGNGQNGKSTLLKIIKGIFGSKNCSGISIHALQNERFAPAQLYGKLANIFPDISNRELNNLGKFKMAISGDEFSVEFKGKDHFMLESFAKHFYSCNEMPDIKDNSDATYRRIYVTKWENEFLAGVNRIENLDHMILSEERSGIFNLILQNYKTLMRNRGFRYRQSIEKVREIIKLESDKLREFVETCLIKETGSYITKNELYQNYVAWCKFNNYEPYSIKKMGIRLLSHGFKDETKRLDKTTMVWIGHNWNFDNEWVKANIRRQNLIC